MNEDLPKTKSNWNFNFILAWYFPFEWRKLLSNELFKATIFDKTISLFSFYLIFCFKYSKFRHIEGKNNWSKCNKILNSLFQWYEKSLKIVTKTGFQELARRGIRLAVGSLRTSIDAKSVWSFIFTNEWIWLLLLRLTEAELCIAYNTHTITDMFIHCFFEIGKLDRLFSFFFRRMRKHQHFYAIFLIFLKNFIRI